MSRYRSTNPMTGLVSAEFPEMGDAEARSVPARALAAYRRWRAEDLEIRAGVLERVASLYRQRAGDLAALTTLEMGKPIAQAMREVELAAEIFEYYASEGRRFLQDEDLEISGSGQARVRTSPIGPLVGVMPWNFPYYQVARFVAPNLLLGNTVIIKHASNCPQQAARMEEIVSEAGAPPDIYINVFATNDQVAAMVASPAVQGVSLTGSERAGSVIGALAGTHLKKCVLELGGSDALIVLNDADVEAAIGAASLGRFLNAGQACTSAKRIIVEEGIWPAFFEGFVRAAQEWELGDPTDPSTTLGPMSSVAARDELAAQVEDALARGAKAHVGGFVPDGDAAFYPATVLTGVEPGMRAYYEELFGPVAVVHRVSGVQSAIELANDSPFGLGGAVFTTDHDVAALVAEQLDVGMVGINATIKSAPDLPFGGVKSSGIGRELGRFGLDEFANKKLIRTP